MNSRTPPITHNRHTPPTQRTMQCELSPHTPFIIRSCSIFLVFHSCVDAGRVGVAVGTHTVILCRTGHGSVNGKRRSPAATCTAQCNTFVYICALLCLPLPSVCRHVCSYASGVVVVVGVVQLCLAHCSSRVEYVRRTREHRKTHTQTQQQQTQTQHKNRRERKRKMDGKGEGGGVV